MYSFHQLSKTKRVSQSWKDSQSRHQLNEGFGVHYNWRVLLIRVKDNYSN